MADCGLVYNKPFRPTQFPAHGGREINTTGFVQTLESPGIQMLRFPGQESPEKGIGTGKPWKSPRILR